jgi:hypothetical protein
MANDVKSGHHHGDQLDTRNDTRRGVGMASKCTNWEEIVPGTSSAHTQLDKMLNPKGQMDDKIIIIIIIIII